MSYDGIKIEIPQMGPSEAVVSHLDGGFRRDANSREIGADESGLINDVLFVRGSLKKGKGWAAIGAAPTGTVLAIRGYSKSIVYPLIRLVSLSGAVMSAEGFDGATWHVSSNTVAVPSGRYVPAFQVFAQNGDEYVVFASLSAIWKLLPTTMVISAVGGTPPANAATVFPFQNRLLAFTGEFVYWSALGNFEDWTSTGSGLLRFFNSNSPTDNIVAGGPLPGQTFAVFANHNIYRGFLTGNASQAIGISTAIFGIGVHAYGTIVAVDDFGLLFLAANNMVYFLTPTFQLIPIGREIYEEIKLTAAAEDIAISANYNHHTGEYALGIYTTMYVFDVIEFRNTQKKKWRRVVSPNNITAFGSYSDNTVFSEAAANVSYAISAATTTKATVAFTGTWQSPCLNRSGKLLTLSALSLFYYAAAQITVTVRVSGNGGLTWNESKTFTLPATNVAMAESVVSVGFETSGQDVRFEIQFDQTSSTDYRINGYRPVLVERGGYEYA